MQKLSLGNLQISKNKISYLEVYCTNNAKKILEKENNVSDNFFDEITNIKIRTENNNAIVLGPPLQEVLIERTEFYGIKRELFTSIEEEFLPLKSIAQVISYLAFNKIGTNKIKSVWYPELKGIEYILETEPKIVLELTKEVRDFFPEEIIKGVNSYFKTQI